MIVKINGLEVEGTPQEVLVIINSNKEEPEPVQINYGNFPTIKRQYKKREQFKHQRWTVTQYNLMKKLKSLGYGNKQIAKKLGRTTSAVATQFWLLNKGK